MEGFRIKERIRHQCPFSLSNVLTFCRIIIHLPIKAFLSFSLSLSSCLSLSVSLRLSLSLYLSLFVSLCQSLFLSLCLSFSLSLSVSFCLSISVSVSVLSLPAYHFLTYCFLEFLVKQYSIFCLLCCSKPVCNVLSTSFRWLSSSSLTLHFGF